MWRIIDRLADIIIDTYPGPIVEIGVGASTQMLAKHAQANHVTLYSCDIKPYRPLFKDHICFTGPSFSFIDQFGGRPSIVLLDGCHDYEIVQKEVEFFLSKLLKGGVIFIHDTLPPTKTHLNRNRCSNAHLVRKELELREDINCFTWPYTANNCGLSMVQKQPECIVDLL